MISLTQTHLKNPTNQWLVSDWFHGPREHELYMTTEACSADFHSSLLGSLSVWDDCCLAAVTLIVN